VVALERAQWTHSPMEWWRCVRSEALRSSLMVLASRRWSVNKAQMVVALWWDGRHRVASYVSFMHGHRSSDSRSKVVGWQVRVRCFPVARGHQSSGSTRYVLEMLSL
jgi:hypothetical protein